PTFFAAERGRTDRPPLGRTGRHATTRTPHQHPALPPASATPEPDACQGCNMNRDFEYMSYTNTDRLAMLENRAAELERRLGETPPPRGIPDYAAEEFGTTAFPMFEPPADEMFDRAPDDDRAADRGAAGYRGSGGDRRPADERSDDYGTGLFGESGTSHRNRGYVPRGGHGAGGYTGGADGFSGAW